MRGSGIKSCARLLKRFSVAKSLVRLSRLLPCAHASKYTDSNFEYQSTNLESSVCLTSIAKSCHSHDLAGFSNETRQPMRQHSCNKEMAARYNLFANVTLVKSAPSRCAKPSKLLASRSGLGPAWPPSFFGIGRSLAREQVPHGRPKCT